MTIITVVPFSGKIYNSFRTKKVDQIGAVVEISAIGRRIDHTMTEDWAEHLYESEPRVKTVANHGTHIRITFDHQVNDLRDAASIGARISESIEKILLPHTEYDGIALHGKDVSDELPAGLH